MHAMKNEELHWVSFDTDPAIEEVLVALQRPAEDIARVTESGTTSAAALQAGVQTIRDVGIDELVVSTADQHPSALLFEVADLLAHANLTVAWQSLRAVPLTAALAASNITTPGGGWVVALRSGKDWAQLVPLVEGASPAPICWFDGTRLLPPEATAPACIEHRLLGFAHGKVLQAPAPAPADARWITLTASDRRVLSQLTRALHCGLLNGVLRRLVGEAYQYAKTRKSAGKPISQHQAVALRLADLALCQQGLSLYLRAAHSAGADAARPSVLNLDYLAETAARIAKDAVQIAAAHGYVEGLPFKRLFEQVRTLISALQMWDAVVEPPHTSFPPSVQDT